MASIRFDKIAIHCLRVTSAVILVGLLASCCYSADIVFICSPVGSFAEQEQLETATNFYGLNLKVIVAGSANDEPALSSAIERKETVGVTIAANALALVNRNAFLQALSRRQGKPVPLLILGIDPDVDARLLDTWSGAAAVGCKQLKNPTWFSVCLWAGQ